MRMRNAAYSVHSRILHTVYAYYSVNNISVAQFTAMEQEREGESERLGKWQAMTLHHPVKRARLLEAQQRENRSMTASHSQQMAAQLGHFQLLKPRGNLMCACVYNTSTGGAGTTGTVVVSSYTT